jgi:hypothetical protein
MSLWDNINKKRQRIKQGSGEKMRKKGDKGAPTPDQIKRAKGEDMEEGKINQAIVRRQDMAKLASLYSKAMKAMPGSPKQKALKKQIDQYRRELGVNESVEEVRQPLTVPKSLAKYVVYKKSGIGKIKQVAHLRAMPKGKELDRVLDKYDADGVIAMSKIQRNKMQVEAVKVGDKVKFKKGIDPKTARSYGDAIRKSGEVVKDYGDGDVKVNFGGNNDKSVDAKLLVKEAKGKYASDAQMDDFLKGMEKHPDVKKMSKHYNRPVGDIVKALRARVSVNRLRGGNVYTLNFTDKDSKLKVKAKKQYAPLKEAVSPAQQAAIAISKKEKMKEDDFEPHMMYDPKTGKGYKAEKPEDHERMKKMGYTHEKPEIKEGKYKVNIKGEGGATVQARSEKEAIAKVMKQLGIANRFAKDRSFMKKISVLGESVEESRAYRDAMKGMKSRSATRGMATTKKDKDVSATDDDRKAANKNIIMQLRKAADLPTGAEVEFERGKGKVSRAQAQAALARFNALARPNDKEKFQKSIRSLSDIKKILGR